ncbi:BQ2448_5689 [Microbotryum intermedium]|uniref:Alpha-1,3/1,6-mannosyltransferase ALG2 n=1 Tax=Microbotryum intermedium TaxID=269621 RepID=A0A238F5C3_9BASI|nr:BQ2448_5689 [Microbotryum intermedium]
MQHVQHNNSPFAAPPAYHREHEPVELPSELRIAFLHPDLGIGGAERLVVDAAVALQQRGHHVEVFTSYHEDGPKGRSFEETRNGTLKVHVLGAWLVPRSILGRFKVVCAMLRQLHLAFSFLLACLLYHLSGLPLLSSLLIPETKPFSSSADWSPLRQLAPFDVLVVDQLSTAIPLLRWFGQNRIVFYCHFPDLLLSPSRPASSAANDPRKDPPWTIAREIRSMYRRPIDTLEQETTGQADKIVVNSGFTAEVFVSTFRTIGRVPRVVYPAVDIKAFGKTVEMGKEDKWLQSQDPMLLSINRFEGKKDIALAVDSFARIAEDHPKLRLVIAGGYDPRLADNVKTLSSLQRLATKHELSYYTYTSSSAAASSGSNAELYKSANVSTTPPAEAPRILFLLNLTGAQKDALLQAPSLVALLYTPSFEHFGIVPIEAMASQSPVLATNSGGPTESIVDDGLDSETTTGLLRVPSADVWATALKDLLALSLKRRQEMGSKGKQRAEKVFSLPRLGEEMEKACVDAARIGKPISSETGFLKLMAFIGIGAFCFISGVVAFWLL